MTSTEFTIGLEGSRNSSKVLKPPGGGSSISFGSQSNSAVEKEPVKVSTTKSRLFGEGEATPIKNYVRRNPITGEGFGIELDDKKEVLLDNPESNDEEKISKDCYVSEKASEQPNTEAPKVVQTSIRVRNPPGGKSSGIF